MKTTDNSLLLKPLDKNSALSSTAKPSGSKSARPMKSMVRVKSIRPQRIELKAGIRKRIIKL